MITPAAENALIFSGTIRPNSAWSARAGSNAAATPSATRLAMTWLAAPVRLLPLVAFRAAASNTLLRDAIGFFLKGMTFEATVAEARATCTRLGISFRTNGKWWTTPEITWAHTLGMR